MCGTGVLSIINCTSITGVKRARITAAVGMVVKPLFPDQCIDEYPYHREHG
jgi:hypothetical protein